MDVALDPDRAQTDLILSDDGKQVRCGDIRQKLQDKQRDLIKDTVSWERRDSLQGDVILSCR